MAPSEYTRSLRKRAWLLGWYPPLANPPTLMLPGKAKSSPVRSSSLGIENGTLKGDLVLHPERGLCIIEVAPRLSGGWFCTDQIPISTGVDLVQIAARIALGETIELDEVRPRAWNPVAVRYFFPPPGVLRAVEGFDDVAGLPWVHRAVLFAAPGDVLEPVTNHTRRAGLVITTGKTRDEAVRRAEEAVRSVRFDVETRP